MIMMGNKETVPVLMPEMLIAKREKEEMESASPDASFEEIAGELMKAIESKNKMKLVRALKVFYKLMEDEEEMEEEETPDMD